MGRSLFSPGFLPDYRKRRALEQAAHVCLVPLGDAQSRAWSGLAAGEGELAGLARRTRGKKDWEWND